MVITQPANGGYVSGPLAAANTGGNVEIRGNAKGGDFMAYKVFVGPGYDVAPEQWQQIGPDHGEQVDNNLLENWNLGGFAPGCTRSS